MTKSLLLRHLALVASSALFFTACGDDSSSNDGEDSSSDDSADDDPSADDDDDDDGPTTDPDTTGNPDTTGGPDDTTGGPDDTTGGPDDTTTGPDDTTTGPDDTTDEGTTDETTGGTTEGTTEGTTGGTTDTGAQECVDEDLGNDLPDGTVSDNTGAGDDFAPGCAGGVGGEDLVYEWTAPADGTYIITTDTATTAIDTVVYVLDACEGGTELACDDDTGTGATSLLGVELTAGQTVLIVVDGYSNAALGAFELVISAAPGGDGGSCCNAGADATPGCDAEPIETCVCGFDAYCCDTDWDTQCAAEAVNICGAVCDAGFCVVGDLGGALGDDVASGTNLGGGDDTNLSCDGLGGEDVAYSWTAPMDGTYVFDTSESDFETAIAIRQPDCNIGGEFACTDETGATVTLAQGDTVHIVIEGLDGATGNYQLDINEFVPDLTCAIEGDLGTMTGDDIATGNTAVLTDDYLPSCTAGDPSPDAIYTWTAAADGVYTFSLAGSDYDTVLALSLACNLPDALCNDQANMTDQSEIIANVVGGTEIIIVIDGWDGLSGNYSLSITPS